MVNVDDIDENIEAHKRSFCNKVFGKMGPGSLRGCIFNLCILSLGTGCLALPQKVSYLSISFTPVVVLIAGAANLWTLLLLSTISHKYNKTNYSELVQLLCGKGMSIFLDIVIVIDIFGIIILYQVILYKLIGGVVLAIGQYNQYKNIDDFVDNSFWKDYIFKFPINYGVATVILLPICLLKDISKMRFASTFGLISLFFLICIVVVECPWFIINYFKNIYDESKPETHLNVYDITVGFNSDMSFFKSIATLFYAYCCHIGAFPVINALANPTKKRVDKVFFRAILLDAFCYTIIGITGYLTQPISTPDLIIERTSIFKSDWVMTVGRISFVLTLFTKIPANYNAMRLSILSLLKIDPKNYSNVINAIITISILAISTFVAVMYQSITDYISLLGSFCSVIISFMIPGIIYVKGNDYQRYHIKNILTVIFVVLLSGVGFLSGAFTIMSIINKHKS